MRRLLFQTPSYLAAEGGFNRSVDASGRVAGSRPRKDVSHLVHSVDGSPARLREMGVFQKESVWSSLAISAFVLSRANLRDPLPLSPVSARGLAT